MFKKSFALLAMMFLTIALFAGCQPAAEPAPSEPEAPAIDKVVMVTDTGGINDKSFNQSAWEGLQTLVEKYPDVTFDYILSNSETEYEANMRTAIDSGSDLTWAVGYMLADPMVETANAMPDGKFGIVDVNWLTNENIVQVSFNEHEGSFLVGVVAGLTTESNKIGFVGGMTGDLIKKFENGFRAGVKAVNPDAVVDAVYAESWSDVQKGKEIAGAMYDQGADIIYHAAGNTGVGVFQAAQERGTGPDGFWTIGVDRDQYEEAPENMLTSMMKKVGTAMAKVTDEYLTSGEFNGGEVIVLGLADDGVGIAPTSEQSIPADKKDDILAKVEEYKQKIINGEISVPKSDEEFANWSIE